MTDFITVQLKVTLEIVWLKLATRIMRIMTIKFTTFICYGNF